MNWANNYTLDYLHGGIRATERELNKRQLVHAGAGASLKEASQPRYLETINSRVALIGAMSTYSSGWEGEGGNRSCPLPLRF
ncbi:CapA family protein [Salisediminibacterium beveridgei]|uniref:CapA family protein n=1 Tax=Salisediminibacterium beveridgei TaxID=632773 RepID=UPI000848034E|nr:CapA family protein [Salisediminibacterium beveridgei]